MHAAPVLQACRRLQVSVQNNVTLVLHAVGGKVDKSQQRSEKERFRSRIKVLSWYSIDLVIEKLLSTVTAAFADRPTLLSFSEFRSVVNAAFSPFSLPGCIEVNE